MQITVLVPTYLRLTDLPRCIDALQAQDRRPDEIIVVVRDTDTETHRYLTSLALGDWLRIAVVSEAGVIAAMNQGLSAATGDIVALTDDDAAPHRDWLARIEAHFASDERIGGVGGRDFVYHGDRLQDGASPLVGVLQWFGRTIGRHHIGVGPARDVDFLKGVNSAYRAEPLRRIGFDRRLLGPGAQVHWELGLGLAITRLGYRLVYDPEIKVDHFPAVRHDADQRGLISEGEALYNTVYNETIAIWEHSSGFRRLGFVFWTLAIGTKVSPGLACAIHAGLSRSPRSMSRFFVTVKARVRAMCSR